MGRELLGLSSDLIVEEIDLGIFTEPELLGWVSVATSLSDLAAAGCEPCGVLNLLTVPPDFTSGWLDAFFCGVAACCRAHGTAVLGGDTNFGPLRAGSTAFGRAFHQVRNPRLHACPGHDLYVAGACGHGNRLAFAQLTRHPLAAAFAEAFRPQVDFRIGTFALELGGSCIDTSDGLIPTLATLLGVQLGVAGAEIDSPPDDVCEFATSVGLPPLAFLLGEVGDYGLLLSVPQSCRRRFQERIAALEPAVCVRRIGRIVAEPELRIIGEEAYCWPLAEMLARRGTAGDAQGRITSALQWLDARYRA